MRPMVYLAVAMALGIGAAGWLRPHPALALAVLLACLCWAALDRRRGAVALLVTVAALGALRLAYAQTAGRGDLSAWQGRKVRLVATVTGEPELRKPRGVTYTVSVEAVEEHEAMGKLSVTQWGGRAPGFGERVELTGTLKEPPGPKTPGGFDRAAYLAQQGVYHIVEVQEVTILGLGRLNAILRAAVATRVRLEQVLKQTLPARDAALMAGLLFGSRSELPPDIKEAFRTSGVLHLLAVSGGNVAMLITPLVLLLRRAGVPRRASAAIAIPVVIFFVLLTGASPSVLRAGLMAVLVLLGEALEREKDALNTLGAAVFLLLIASPSTLFDLGFQLSVGATLGILLYARRIQEWLAPRFQAFVGEKAGGWLAAGLSVTFAAQLVVEPITLHNFGATSLIAPVANLLVLAFLEPIVVVGMVSTVIGVLAAPIAWTLNWFVRLGLWLLLFTVNATSAVPGAHVEPGRLPLAGVVAWYGALALVSAPGLRGALVKALSPLRTSGRRTKLAGACVAALLLSTFLTWRIALADPPDTLKVTVLDVGQGDAILVQAPGGHTMLIDAGPASPPDPVKGYTGYDAAEEVILPYLRQQRIRRLDYFVLTHPHQDHAGGAAAVLQAVKVDLFLDTSLDHGAHGYEQALVALTQHQVPVRRPVEGERLTLGPDVLLEVLNPPREPISGTRSDENSNSIVFRLRYRQFSMLLTGDMEAVVEERLLADGAPVRADVLKVAHHGSGYSSTEPFLRAVSPSWAIISAGSGNPFGHPDREALERLWAVGATVYRTDRNGPVTVKTDGVRVVISAAKGKGENGETARPLGLRGRPLVFAW